MRLSKLDLILSAERDLQPLVSKARDLGALSQLVQRFLSADLASQTRVVNLREGEVVLSAAHSAAAAKLRLLAPSLCRFLSNQRWQVSSAVVRVQPNASRNGAAASQKTAQLSTPTIDTLRQLYEGMSASPARDALERLLARRGAIQCEKVPPRRTEPGPAPKRKPRI
ncbi:MAG TPA: DciA family protein [Burkholderiales bacterium]|nr:DciA family protein [Burkholderiales bacterium]